MTDIAREAAIERVRAYVGARNGYPGQSPSSVTLGDLRLLLSGVEEAAGLIANWRERANLSRAAAGDASFSNDERSTFDGAADGYRAAANDLEAALDPHQPSEAHAAALASGLERALPYVVNGHDHDGPRCIACEVEPPIRQALSAYKGDGT